MSRTKFRRKDSHKFKRVGESWRKPRGLKNAQRKKKKGNIVMPNVGYRSPKKGRGLHPSGLKEVMVHNPDGLEGIDKEKEAVRIGSSVGRRKRTLIVEKAEKLGLRVLNPGLGGDKA